MARTFSIITTCKGRLEHLKLSLPRMLEQGATDVIVVDYSCPQGTGRYVRKHFPAARVVAVKGEEHFSNWKARNAGAAAAKGDLLVFCDADVILRTGALAAALDKLPSDGFGFFKGNAPKRLNKSLRAVANNQLKGFHVMPAAAFARVGGYDELLEGYASGADTDLQSRLDLAGIKLSPLDLGIVEDTIDHGVAQRLENHRDSARVSYGAGVLYRAAKFKLLQLTGDLEAPLDTRKLLYAKAREQALRLASHNAGAVTLMFEDGPVKMPRLLGFDAATQRVSLKVELIGTKKAAPPK